MAPCFHFPQKWDFVTHLPLSITYCLGITNITLFVPRIKLIIIMCVSGICNISFYLLLMTTTLNLSTSFSSTVILFSKWVKYPLNMNDYFLKGINIIFSSKYLIFFLYQMAIGCVTKKKSVNKMRINQIRVDKIRSKLSVNEPFHLLLSFFENCLFLSLNICNSIKYLFDFLWTSMHKVHESDLFADI